MAAEPRIQQNYYSPVVGGSTIARDDIGTSSSQITGSDPGRQKIVFFNPNQLTNVNIMVCQSLDADGNALAATFADPAGGIIIFPGMSLTVEGNGAQGAWRCAAESGTQAVTALVSQTR